MVFSVYSCVLLLFMSRRPTTQKTFDPCRICKKIISGTTLLFMNLLAFPLVGVVWLSGCATWKDIIFTWKCFTCAFCMEAVQVVQLCRCYSTVTVCLGPNYIVLRFILRCVVRSSWDKSYDVARKSYDIS